MSQSEIKISATGSSSLRFSELWENRELLYFFTWRDIKVKYKQTYLGVLWAILQPLLLMAVFYVVFSRTLKISVGMSYPVYTFAGLLLWGLFSSGILHSSESLLNNSLIIRKIYFPRIFLPLSSLLTALVDFLIACTIFVVLLLIFRQPVNVYAIFCFPLAVLLTFISSFGIGTLVAALNIKYRDFRYLLPFAIQFLFFSSQVVYSIHSLGEGWMKWLLYCNPLNGALELFYYSLNNSFLDTTGILISSCSALLFITTGLIYFKKTENYFADLI